MPIATSQLERRRHPRTPLRMDIGVLRLDPDGGEVLDTLHMSDISRSGMGAYCSRRFIPGQKVVLSLPLSATLGRRNVYATIIRCREAQTGYRVGMQFDMASVPSACMPSPYAMAA